MDTSLDEAHRRCKGERALLSQGRLTNGNENLRGASSRASAVAVSLARLREGRRSSGFVRSTAAHRRRTNDAIGRSLRPVSCAARVSSHTVELRQMRCVRLDLAGSGSGAPPRPLSASAPRHRPAARQCAVRAMKRVAMKIDLHRLSCGYPEMTCAMRLFSCSPPALASSA